jgi:translation elongation factor P/translation initiation factor 5A
MSTPTTNNNNNNLLLLLPSQIKKGMRLKIKGEICTVSTIATMSMGMHGVRKSIITGMDHQGEKREDVFSDDMMVEILFS